MKKPASLLIFVAITSAFAVVDVFKTAVITSTPLVINVRDQQFLRIYNFTQEGVASPRGVIIAAAATPTATATATATSTPVPTATPAGADLIATKSDNVGGHAITPSSWTWKITVANNGGSSSTFLDGQTILTD